MSELVIRNRQRTRALNLRLLRRIVHHVIDKQLKISGYELGIHFVSPDEMAGVNRRFLEHEGSTDVITFDHNETRESERIHGEIFISVADAVRQAREFGTTWQSEIVRYVIHGLLHLRGYDDLHMARRREMKREENRLLRLVESTFALRDVARTRP